jgi:hypothetical protein
MSEMIVDKKIERSVLFTLAREKFGSFVKAVVDLKKSIMIIGMEFHVQGQAILLEKGSRKQDLWGIRIYPDKAGEEMIVFESMINFRPSEKNLSREVKDVKIRQKIVEIVNQLIQES